MKIKIRQFVLMALVGFALCTVREKVLGLGSDYQNGQRVLGRGLWPAGMEDLVNSTNRVHGFFVNDEDVFFFRGSAADFSNFLREFSKIRGPVNRHPLVLHNGVGEAKSPWENTGRPCDWELDGRGNGWKAGVVTNYVLEVHFWTGGRIAMDKITIPPGVEIEKAALNDETARGLRITCVPSKKNFVVRESVNLWCMVTNTTENVKAIAWHPSSGSHFSLAKDEASWTTGILPLVMPKLRDSFKIGPISGTPEYALLLPPHSSLNLLLTYKADSPEKFRGIVAYDPDTHGGGFFGSKAEAKAREACVFSNPFEFEVIGTKK